MESTTSTRKRRAGAKTTKRATSGKLSRATSGRLSRSEKVKTAPDKGPLSVPLPEELRDRLARQASARGLKMATAARVLLDERLRDLEDTQELSQAEEWQRAQAWAAWEALQAGGARDVPMDEFRAATERALARRGAGGRSR